MQKQDLEVGISENSCGVPFQTFSLIFSALRLRLQKPLTMLSENWLLVWLTILTVLYIMVEILRTHDDLPLRESFTQELGNLVAKDLLAIATLPHEEGVAPVKGAS